MASERKYLGMTIQQLGILGGLVAIACLLCSFTSVLIVRQNLNRPSVGATQSIPTVRPTSTIVMTPTFVPTATSTIVPYEQRIPEGWTQYKTALIELWLPKGYKKAAPAAITGVSGNAVVMELALVSTIKTYTYKPTVSISYEPLTTTTLENFVDQKLAGIPTEVNIAEHRKVSINSMDVYRIIFEGHTNTNVDTNDLLFVFQDGGTVWYVKYSAEIKDFFNLLPTFEQSVRTFRIVR